MKKLNSALYNLKTSFLLMFAYLGSFFFSYLEILSLSGLYNYDKWLIPLIDALFYGTFSFLICFLSIRLLKSVYALLALALIFNISLVICSSYNAEHMHLTQKINNQYLFMDGEITFLGAVYQMINPSLILFVLPIFFLLRTLNRVK